MANKNSPPPWMGIVLCFMTCMGTILIWLPHPQWGCLGGRKIDWRKKKLLCLRKLNFTYAPLVSFLDFILRGLGRQLKFALTSQGNKAFILKL